MKQFLRVFLLFGSLTVAMSLFKIVFCIFNGGYDSSDILAAMWHGFCMDMSVAGYLSALPALLSIAMIWCDNKWLKVGCKTVLAVESIVLSAALTSNVALYKYWHFPLDNTPLFYLFSSPSAAFASLPGELWILAFAVVAVLSWLLYKLAVDAFFIWPASLSRLLQKKENKVVATVVAVLSAAVLFIPIRGGVTVSTMNLSRVYYSDDLRKNHAAVNPLFSLLHSLSMRQDYADRFHLMPDAEADAIVNKLYATDTAVADSIPHLPYKPDIHFIILESFSSHLFASLGGEPVAAKLDSIAAEGLMFTDIYASSFRTDRGLVALLCGFPAQPTMSLMKYTDKIDRLPSIAKELSNAGYETSYVYGGDINFTNMNSLLMANGFQQIVKDKDFPVGERLSKWGVHDDKLIDRAWELAKSRRTNSPRFTVIQTSSSHEPFDVPFKGRFAEKEKNAFEYTDRCVAAYVDSLRTLPNYDRTLIVIVPDHYGAWPELEDHQARHRVPLILAGGVAEQLKGHVDSSVLARTGSQTDIAATLLQLVGMDSHAFRYSNNLLDPSRRGFAYFSEPSWIGMKSDDGYAEINVDTEKPAAGSKGKLLEWLQAYITSLYRDIRNL